MARGFAAGLVHGALICGAGLAVLSLIAPQPQRQVETAALQVPDAPPLLPDVPAPTVPEVVQQAAPSADTAADTAAAAPLPADTSPATQTLSLPAGAEFARGSDVAPQIPAPMAAVALRPGALPAVVAPRDETAPAAADTSAQPEARGDAPAAPVMQSPVPDRVDLPQIAGDAALPVSPPGQVMTPGLDRLPDAMPLADQAPAPQQAASVAPDISVPEPVFALPPDAPSQPVAQAGIDAVVAETMAETAGMPASVAVISASPGSGFDLSTPPDFDALRLTSPRSTPTDAN